MARPPPQRTRPASDAPLVSPESFRRDDRVLSRGEFLAIQRRGRRLRGPHLTLVLFERGDGLRPRLGVTLTRKCGTAVVRHRVRRWLREVFRRNREHFLAGTDHVVVVHEGAEPLAFDTVRTEVLELMQRARQSPRGPSPRRSRTP